MTSVSLTILMPEVAAAIRDLAAAVRANTQQEHNLMTTLADVQTKVSAQSAGIDSAVVLLNQLAQLVRDNAADPVALAALADELDAKTAALAAAVAADAVPTP